MAIPTNHFRLYGSRTAPRLQQLFVFDADDQFLLERHALTDVDADVFQEEPNHSVGEWLLTINHDWRNVPFVESPAMTDTSQTAVDAAKFDAVRLAFEQWYIQERKEFGLPVDAEELAELRDGDEYGFGRGHAYASLYAVLNGKWQAWKAAIAAQPQVAVPAGWKLVPIEPTEAMQQTGAHSIIDGQESRPSMSWADEAAMAYRAMLAAAPVAGQQDSAQQSEVKP